MATFVLVHGAWHGGWCWERLVPRLTAKGHDAHAPTLTGLADRAGELHARVGLQTHVDDVVRVLVENSLEDVVLVGHSYGGMVITGAAEGAAPRIRKLVYLDAMVPEHGQSMFECAPEIEAGIRSLSSVQDGVEVARVVPPQIWGVSEPTDVEWIGSRMTPHPMRCATDKLEALGNVAAHLPRAYILLSDIGRSAFDAATPEAGWVRCECMLGHEAPITHPTEVVAALLSCA